MAPQPATRTTNTLYAEFYRPLVARLHRRGMLTVGKGGWRGRWRSFETGHRSAVYATGFDGEGKPRVFLALFGGRHLPRYRALLQHREEIAGKVEGTFVWDEAREGASQLSVKLERDEACSLTGSEEDLERAREWMAASLLALRGALQPCLDQVMGSVNEDGKAGAERGEPADQVTGSAQHESEGGALARRMNGALLAQPPGRHAGAARFVLDLPNLPVEAIPFGPRFLERPERLEALALDRAAPHRVVDGRELRPQPSARFWRAAAIRAARACASRAAAIRARQ